MKKVVVDTDIIIDYLRQPRKDTFFKKLIQDKNLKVLLPAICLTELYIGKSAAKPKEINKIKKIISKMNLVLADKNISETAGVFIRTYSNLYLADALVAATALKKNASLCTFNQKHFENIAGLKLFN